jgi:hypothetical protein
VDLSKSYGLWVALSYDGLWNEGFRILETGAFIVFGKGIEELIRLWVFFGNWYPDISALFKRVDGRIKVQAKRVDVREKVQAKLVYMLFMGVEEVPHFLRGLLNLNIF